MNVLTAADLGAWVREARRRLGLTQTDLAQRMGVAQSWVSRLERGNPRLEVQMVLDALAALGTPLSTPPLPDPVDAPPGASPDQADSRPDQPQPDQPQPRRSGAADENPFADVFGRLTDQR